MAPESRGSSPMSLTILSVAYPFSPVSRHSVGGAEQILAQLDEFLVKNQHRSLVLAEESSEIAGTLLPLKKCPGQITGAAREEIYSETRLKIKWALENCSVDLLHFHGIDFHQYLPVSGPGSQVPVLVTLHLPLSWYPKDVFQTSRANVFFQCVSSSQLATAPKMPGLVGFIENGVSLPLRRSRHHAFVLSMGRICPEKGFHLSLDAARKSAAPMLLAGKVFPYVAHQEYFRTEILPRLDQQRRFIGPAENDRKQTLLSWAQCLLIPSLAQETSSLVAMEALAAGTPVIAFPNGALPEVIEDGRTGFLVKNTDEMARAIDQCRGLDPEVCRRVARERFSSERMARSYL
ncbi:MAG: hypothetical protein A2070_13670, partial [Bdellovibrionales bacterium GWC1_52_8]